MRLFANEGSREVTRVTIARIQGNWEIVTFEIYGRSLDGYVSRAGGNLG